MIKKYTQLYFYYEINKQLFPIFLFLCFGIAIVLQPSCNENDNFVEVDNHSTYLSINIKDNQLFSYNEYLPVVAPLQRDLSTTQAARKKARNNPPANKLQPSIARCFVLPSLVLIIPASCFYVFRTLYPHHHCCLPSSYVKIRSSVPCVWFRNRNKAFVGALS